MTILCPTLLHLLCCLLLLSAMPSHSLAAFPADGSFRGWSISHAIPRPVNDVVYVLDRPNHIRTMSRTTGAPLQYNVTIDNAYIVAMAVDGLTGAVYALVEPVNYFTFVDVSDYTLLSFTADLQPVGNVSLAATLSPPPMWDDRLLSVTLPVDRLNLIYFARQLGNGTVLVHVITPSLKLAHTWTAPFVGSSSLSYLMAMGPDDSLYFQATDLRWYSRDEHWPTYKTSTAGVVQMTMYLPLSAYTCQYVSAMAVLHRTGGIALACGNNMLLFDGFGKRVQSFSYEAPTWRIIQSLAFDRTERILAVAGNLGVQVISSANGDLLNSWGNDVPSLLYAQMLAYQPSSRSLIALRVDGDVPVIRIDADRGTLLQTYALPSRLDNCYPLASAVGGTGDMHVLLSCYHITDDFDFIRSVVLHTMTAAGRVRREVQLSGWTDDMLQPQLLVCEDVQLFYLVTNTYLDSRVIVFAFNGTNVFNMTDTRIGTLGGWNTQLLRVNDNTLAVVDTDHSRIVLVDLLNGAYFGIINAPHDTFILAAVYDASSDSWYRSELDLVNGSWTNSSIRQYAADGAVLSSYSLAGEEINLLTVGGSGDARRLYALGGYEGQVGWWHIGSQQSAQLAVSLAKRHSSPMRMSVPTTDQPRHSEQFQAAVQLRRQQWIRERQRREESSAPAEWRQARASRAKKAASNHQHAIRA